MSKFRIDYHKYNEEEGEFVCLDRWDEEEQVWKSYLAFNLARPEAYERIVDSLCWMMDREGPLVLE